MVFGPTAISVKTYAVCTGILYSKFFAATLIQGGKNFPAGNRPPEDVALKSLQRGMPKQTFGLAPTEDYKILAAREDAQRWSRIVMSDLESLPFAFFVFGAGLLVEANESVAVSAMSVYTGARLAHMWAYANKMQPHRGYFYMLSASMIWVGIGNALTTVLAQ